MKPITKRHMQRLIQNYVDTAVNLSWDGHSCETPEDYAQVRKKAREAKRKCLDAVEELINQQKNR